MSTFWERFSWLILLFLFLECVEERDENNDNILTAINGKELSEHTIERLKSEGTSAIILPL